MLLALNRTIEARASAEDQRFVNNSRRLRTAAMRLQATLTRTAGVNVDFAVGATTSVNNAFSNDKSIRKALSDSQKEKETTKNQFSHDSPQLESTGGAAQTLANEHDQKNSHNQSWHRGQPSFPTRGRGGGFAGNKRGNRGNRGGRHAFRGRGNRGRGNGRRQQRGGKQPNAKDSIQHRRIKKR